MNAYQFNNEFDSSKVLITGLCFQQTDFEKLSKKFRRKSFNVSMKYEPNFQQNHF